MHITCQGLSRRGCCARAGRLGAKLGASQDCISRPTVDRLYTTWGLKAIRADMPRCSTLVVCAVPRCHEPERNALHACLPLTTAYPGTRISWRGVSCFQCAAAARLPSGTVVLCCV